VNPNTKYQVGDLILIKNIVPLLRPHLCLHLLPRLKNTFGIITKVKKHTDLYEKGSTENDNAYIWYSQADNKEYYFYQDEVDGEVIV
jgi:hypothetical protein